MIERLAAALADRYRIDRELGAGGMATVFLAEDRKHHRFVAIKVLREDFAALLGAKRFLQEIETTARLQHPHILPLHDSGEADGLLFYVMPFVEGESLRGRIERDGVLPVADAVRIGVEIADALDYAHRHGVIHRDIKPENILLHEGRSQLADFGIALAPGSAEGRLTETGISVGTPGYMSPEQALGEREIDARTDIYALGAVLYEALTGVPPFTGPTARAIVAQVITEKVVPPSRRRAEVPVGIEAAIMKALAKDPAERFPSAGAFREVLQGTGLRVRRRGFRWGRLGIAAGVAGAGIVAALTLRPARAGRAPPVRGSADTTVQRLVGEGKYWMLRRTQQGCDESTRRLSEATARDSTDLEAWEGLANSSAFCALFGNGDPYTWWVSAQAIAQRSLTLDSGSATAWMVRGMAHLFARQDWTSALRDLNHSLELDSTRYQPWLYRTWAFEAINQPDSALATIRHASRLAPTENIVGARLGNVLTMRGDTAGARQVIDDVLRRDPEDFQAHQTLMTTAVTVGNCREAQTLLAWFARHHATAPAPGTASYRLNSALAAQAWVVCGDFSRARRYADSLIAAGRSGDFVDYGALALLYAQLRDSDAMYGALDRAIQQHNWSLWDVSPAPIYRPYRASPRFQEILRRLHEN